MSGVDRVFLGGGEMGALMRSIDWARTPLGPVEGWPQSLRSVLSLVLTSPSPTFLWWGRAFIQFYNDAYRPIMGGLHPRGLGQCGPDCWGEAWKVVYPLVEAAMERGEASAIADGMLPLVRHGFVEECYFNYTYTPVRNESGEVGGIFCAVTETTQRILGERRMRMLRELSIRTAAGKSVEAVFRSTEEVLAQAPSDIPFALLYALEGERARLVACCGLARGGAAAPVEVEVEGSGDSPWPLATVARSDQEVLVEGLGRRLGPLPGGPWPEPTARALVLPVKGADGESSSVLVAGLSPRRPLDEEYRGFLQLLARQVASAVSGARGYEQERLRAEGLAELDRAKTAFFSNVSHEFRTPLTLLLGPVEDALADGNEPLGPVQRERLVLVRRSGARLLKLVNALLDFSRLEAGRARATFEPTDLSAFTAELASHFESAARRARLTLSVDVPPLPEAVWVDREAWEKVVFNLLSNALKYTVSGGIFVSLAAPDGCVELRVRDTGMGIPKEELPHVFERFHRVEGVAARGQEGSGIGLALVRELVKLHGGSVEAESVLGQGSTFTVRVPRGHAHLPRESLLTERPLEALSARASPYVEEALGWLPEDTPKAEGETRAAARPEARARILVADDNPDLRTYISGLLSPVFEVEAVEDGEAALRVARTRKPDLILSDVMMPRLGGFGFLREVRADPGLRVVPFILLSARAGEESSVEGLEAGADDYLVKPFGSRELLARVRSNLELARRREESARQEAVAASLREAVRARDEFLSVASHELKTPLAAFRLHLELIGRGLGTESSTRLGERLTSASRQVRRLASLVETLLDVSQITTGRLQLSLDTLDLSSLVAEAVARMREESTRAGSRVTLEADASLVGAYDRLRMDQVVTNLLTNAAKYGGGKPIEVTLKRAGARVRLSVTDHGIGIAREDRERIFERFERAVPVRQYGGLGLGLWIARQVVEAHGGSIAVTDTPGGGATFTVELPVEP